MPLVAFKEIFYGTIGSGASEDIKYQSDGDYIIKHILIIDKDDLSLSKLRVTVSLEQTALTKDTVPATVFGRNIRDAWTIDWAITKGQVLKMTIKNEDSTDRTISVVLALYTLS